MSLDLLDGKVLDNPPRPQYLSCLPDSSKLLKGVSCVPKGNDLNTTRTTNISNNSITNKMTGPLTPTSHSLEDHQSDTSDHDDLGDTNPSSIEDQNRQSPDHYSQDLNLNSKMPTKRNQEFDKLSLLLSPMTPKEKIENVDPSVETEDTVVTGTSSAKNTNTIITNTTTITDQNVLNEISTSGSSKIQQPKISKSAPLLSLPLMKRRHTDSFLPALGRQSMENSNDAPDAKSRPTTKASLSTENYSQFKSRTYTDLHLQARLSVADSEVARMRSAIKRRSTLRRRDVFDSDQVLLGNKIDEGHRNFVMAYNMLTGIRVAVSSCSGVMKTLDDRDFHATKKLTFNSDGSELTPSSKYDFKFKDYCPEVFRELRTMFGIDPADYLMSITGKYILSELGSPGKSGSFFYYSRDFRFIIKTIHHGEHKQLRKILKAYYLHVKENPNTLVSQFYGLHRLKVAGGIKKIHFIVMNNLFPPHRDIHLKYDLKGSTWGRYTRVEEQVKGKEKKELSDYTLKDLNWLERDDRIKFGPEKRKIFLTQLEADVKLLKKINVMDYSLLLGIHDVKKGNSLATAKLSVYEPKSSHRYDLFKTNPRDIDRGVDLPNGVFPGRSKYIFYGHDGGIRATDENNEPLPEIYYLGIIDCLTNYSLKKRLETFWRSLSHARATISAIPSKEYGDRFLAFIKEGLSSKKLKKN